MRKVGKYIFAGDCDTLEKEVLNKECLEERYRLNYQGYRSLEHETGSKNILVMGRHYYRYLESMIKSYRRLKESI